MSKEDELRELIITGQTKAVRDHYGEPPLTADALAAIEATEAAKLGRTQHARLVNKCESEYSVKPEPERKQLALESARINSVVNCALEALGMEADVQVAPYPPGLQAWAESAIAEGARA